MSRAYGVLLVAFALLTGRALSAGAPSGLLRPPRHPSVFELNARTIVGELKAAVGPKATVDDIPNDVLNDIEACGFDYVYMLGVWQGSKQSLSRAMELSAAEGHPETSACPSPYSITDYTVSSDIGGEAALARLRERLNLRGMRLMLDFVGNHVAVDHPWVTQKPQLFVQGTEEELAANPANYFKVGKAVVAHGRDSMFDGWEDTAQLNYANAETRKEMLECLTKVASAADAVRCDMAMLLCPDSMIATWGEEKLQGKPAPFWSEAIKTAKAKSNNGECVFLADCYWGKEWELLEQGFDFATDKTLYDRLVDRNTEGLTEHLSADAAFQERCARFLETHDLHRASEILADAQQHTAAAVIAYANAGMKIFHDGQLTGRKEHMPLHRWLRNVNETSDAYTSSNYRRLLTTVLNRPEVKDGECRTCTITASMDGDPSHKNIIAQCCWDDTGRASVYIVNYSPEPATGHVILPANFLVAQSPGFPVPNTHNLKAKKAVPLSEVEGEQTVVMRDMFGTVEMEDKDAAVLRGHHGGAWFKLAPWQIIAYELTLK